MADWEGSMIGALGASLGFASGILARCIYWALHAVMVRLVGTENVMEGRRLEANNRQDTSSGVD